LWTVRVEQGYAQQTEGRDVLAVHRRNPEGRMGMKVIEPGHIYQLQHLDGSGAGLLTFVNREAGTQHEGTQTQEVLRVLIDRTQHCDHCLRWDGNDKIIYHLRMAIALHEARALERKVEKGLFEPEKVATANDGHFALRAATAMYDEANGRRP
jgi:hypothetical protein